MAGTPLLLIGAGGHAAACIDVIEQQARYSIAGLVGSTEEVGTQVCGYPVLGSDTQLAELLARIGCALIAVGQIKTPEPRTRLFAELTRLGCEMPVIVSPHAHVSRYAALGAGTIVMHGALVNARATVGRNCILNSQSLVEHDARIGDHCHVATGAIINGAASVGDGSFVGSQSSVRQEVRVGARCVIGMGERVLSDCPDDTILPAAAAT